MKIYRISIAYLFFLIVVFGSFSIPQYTKACSSATPCVISDTSPTSIKTSVETTITAIEATLSTALNVTNTAANVAMQVNAYVLQPLAFVLSGNLMKMLTAGVIAFVIGKANGTGVPQFATDVMMSMQTVSDSQALAYLNSFGRNSNSPFAYSIASALRLNYLQKTSLAGFWAANMNTLARSSPNVNAFLAGNWSQGGVAAWFALTTETQNNPYMLYQTSQSKMSTLIGSGVGGVTGARAAQLSWGQGFMSWCGATEMTTTEDNDGTRMEGINPGDACTDTKTGAPGIIKTPGSTIKATLDKVLGGQQDQIVRMGNIGPQINQILGNVATVLQTVNFASQILGGSGSGGLFGVDQSSGANSASRLMQYQATPSLGITNADVYKNATTIGATGPDMTSRITRYQTAWNTIGGAANAASMTVQSLITYCNAQATDPYASLAVINAQVSAARTALANEIEPVLAQAATAAENITAAAAMVNKVQSELASGTDTAESAYVTDVQTLQTMPPTMTDVANALQDSQTFGTATAIPDGSLTVAGGSLIDQMSLISTNAEALKANCTPVPPPPAG